MPPVRSLAQAAAIVCGLTVLGALLGGAWPALAPGGRPHPTLHGTLREAVSILTANLRVLAAPFLLAAFGVHRGRRGRPFGDLLIGTVVALNTVRVGLALGRSGASLLPYLPQLPLEWPALALSLGSWLMLRSQPVKAQQLASQAALIVLIAAAAAVCETLLAPHLPARSPTARSHPAEPVAENTSPSHPRARRDDLPAPELCAGRDLIASRSPKAPFPSLRSVPLGRRPAPDPTCQPPTIPTRRDQT